MKDNVVYIDDNRVLMPCGNNIVIHNNDAKFQVSIPGTVRSDAWPSRERGGRAS